MKNEYLKTLWMLRFRKIQESEEEAARKFQEILERCLRELGPEHEVTVLLGRIVKDEKMHALLGGELVRICRETHPEFDAGDI